MSMSKGQHSRNIQERCLSQLGVQDKVAGPRTVHKLELHIEAVEMLFRGRVYIHTLEEGMDKENSQEAHPGAGYLTAEVLFPLSLPGLTGADKGMEA